MSALVRGPESKLVRRGELVRIPERQIELTYNLRVPIRQTQSAACSFVDPTIGWNRLRILTAFTFISVVGPNLPSMSEEERSRKPRTA